MAHLSGFVLPNTSRLADYIISGAIDNAYRYSFLFAPILLPLSGTLDNAYRYSFLFAPVLLPHSIMNVDEYGISCNPRDRSKAHIELIGRQPAPHLSKCRALSR